MYKAKIGFVSNENKGFIITFDNNYTISAQFGISNYCEVKEYPYTSHTEMKTSDLCWFSSNCEIAVWKAKEDEEIWVTQEVIKAVFDEDLYDDVKGYVSPNDFAKIVAYVSALKNE